VLVLAPPSTAVYGGLGVTYGQDYTLQAAAAMALVGTIVLGAQIPTLLRLDKAPSITTVTEVNK
jgi:hypothetical protein